MTSTSEKILLVRMAETADVLSIGIPALRFVREQSPDAEIHMLTHGSGVEVFNLAEPGVRVIHLPGHHWPDDILQGMEAFIGLAETIVGENYSQIINLDTAFLPCFLARFLKDAGEPVAGNYLSKSVAELVDGIKLQTLSADYVNQQQNYLQSSWLSMQQWNTEWWRHGQPPEFGYAEFYLKKCCGFNKLNMDMHLPVSVSESKMQVALYLPDYAQLSELQDRLSKSGISVFLVPDSAISPEVLESIQCSQLLVTQPALSFWLARALNKPTLLVPGTMDPRILMPDYATDQSEFPVAVSQLSEGIVALLRGENEA